MRFCLPTMINFVRIHTGEMVSIGSLDKEDFEKWLSQYNAGLRKHWEKKSKKKQEETKCAK